jgi:3-isopropylmalate/(R)-2-methylmalate dehydratase small subunit
MRVWKFSDDINTDLITPGRYNLTTDKAQLAKIAFIEYRPEFAREVEEGDMIVAGKNFGCGSSRETAPLALKSAGIKTIIAKSFARILFRNAINIGLPVVICKEADRIEEGDQVEIDFEKGLIHNLTKKEDLKVTPLPAFLIEILESGGLINYLKRRSLRIR